MLVLYKSSIILILIAARFWSVYSGVKKTQRQNAHVKRSLRLISNTTETNSKRRFFPKKPTHFKDSPDPRLERSNGIKFRNSFSGKKKLVLLMGCGYPATHNLFPGDRGARARPLSYQTCGHQIEGSLCSAAASMPTHTSERESNLKKAWEPSGELN